jgi:photosystem II stability/assembly factor-like uncharacterized protein
MPGLGYISPDIFAPSEVLAEVGVLRLARREYVESLDALLRSGFWMDAAYVAERVLTVDELQTYVDRDWQVVTPAETVKETVERPYGDWQPTNIRQQIRYLLARRLARINRDDEAREYFPGDALPKFDALMTALRTARDESLPPDQRGKAFFVAGWMTRTNGMELFGMEAEPDWLRSGGSYNWGGVSVASRTNESFKLLPATADELTRARMHAPDPDARFHYRYQAAELAFDAAKLMPDNSNETARVLCTAGSWIKYLDPKKADPIYKALVRRCGKTAIGRQADLMRWFPVLDAAGSPIPYRPDPRQPFPDPEFGSIQMMDRENGWAQSARAVFRANDWVFNDKAILQTTNGGATWKRVLCADEDDEMSAFFYDANTAWVATAYDEDTNVTIFRTTDGGHSWIHSSFCQATFVMDDFGLILSFPSADKGWLMLISDHGMNSSPGDLYRTDDGGADWQLVNSTDKNPHAEENYEQASEPDFENPHPYLVCGGSITFQNASNGWAFGSLASTTPAFLFATGDAGQTWQMETFQLPPSLLNGRIRPAELPHFFGDDGIIGTIFAPNDSESTNFCTVIYNTHNGGKTWQPTMPVKFDGVWNFISAQKGWLWSPEPHSSNSTAPVKGILYRTGDGGETWNSLPADNGLEKYLTHGEDIVQLDFVDEDCGWAIARDWHNVTQLLHTTDSGHTWNAVQTKMQK